MHFGEVDSDGDYPEAKSGWGTFTIPRFRIPHACRVLKIILPFAIVALICGGSLQYVSHTNARMLRYEKQLQSLRLAFRNSDKRFEERVKREISDSVELQLAHSISKRSSEDAPPERREYLEPKNGNLSGGVTYTRWGRRNCPNGKLTRFVYSGYMAGSHFTHTGGGSNYICLHWNVSYTPGKYVEGNQGGSYLYGTEFHDSGWMYQLFDLSETEANGLQFHSVPCAICMAEARVSKMMIPGRETCPAGWHKEYVGYLMAGSHGDKHSSDYICVDEQPHIVPGTIGDQDGAKLQMVETQCASLLCEPFVAGRELRCVVCTI